MEHLIPACVFLLVLCGFLLVALCSVISDYHESKQRLQTAEETAERKSAELAKLRHKLDTIRRALDNNE